MGKTSTKRAKKVIPNLSTRGGKRPGAGRPRVLIDPVQVGVRIERSDFDRLAREPGGAVAAIRRLVASR